MVPNDDDDDDDNVDDDDDDDDDDNDDDDDDDDKYSIFLTPSLSLSSLLDKDRALFERIRKLSVSA